VRFTQRRNKKEIKGLKQKRMGDFVSGREEVDKCEKKGAGKWEHLKSRGFGPVGSGDYKKKTTGVRGGPVRKEKARLVDKELVCHSRSIQCQVSEGQGILDGANRLKTHRNGKEGEITLLGRESWNEGATTSFKNLKPQEREGGERSLTTSPNIEEL